MSRSDTSWDLITGEYAPTPGGIADYSSLVARGLAEVVAEVRVWTSPLGPGLVEADPHPRLFIHREAGTWSRRDLDNLDAALDRRPGPRRLLVQYAPNAYGHRGMNFGLAAWLGRRRRRGDSVRIMFHEVTYIPKPGDSIARRLLAMGQRRIVARLLAAADRVDIAIPAWESMLRPLDPTRGRPYGWRPVPSNVPVVDDPAAVASTRLTLQPPGVSTLLGSFGTYAPDVVALLEPAALPLLIDRDQLGMVLIGRGGRAVADRWAREHPTLAGRVAATGECDPRRLSLTLQACDALIQPYPGGICTKRGSLMAGIAHGRATASTSGEVSEPIWAESDAVALAPEGDVPRLRDALARLIDDPVARRDRGRAGRDLYDRRFAVDRTIAALLDPDEESRP